MANFNSATGYQWTLLSAASISGFNAADFTLNTSAFSNSLGIGDFYLSATATDVYPEFFPGSRAVDRDAHRGRRRGRGVCPEKAQAGRA
jgi:hypothetical protein